MARKYGVKGDADANPRLRAQVQGLRGDMLSAAERNPLPARFSAVAHPDRPAMVIRDSTTGRTAEVALCDYYGARALLHALFGA